MKWVREKIELRRKTFFHKNKRWQFALKNIYRFKKKFETVTSLLWNKL